MVAAGSLASRALAAGSRALAAGSLGSQAAASHKDTLEEGVHNHEVVGSGEGAVEVHGVAVDDVAGNHTHVVVVRTHEVVDRRSRGMELTADKGLSWICCGSRRGHSVQGGSSQLSRQRLSKPPTPRSWALQEATTAAVALVAAAAVEKGLKPCYAI